MTELCAQTPPPMATLLAAAQKGDEDAFQALVRPHLGELRAHCYRMLGSMHDAEDVLQEVLLRAWRSLATFAGLGSWRSWLYRIATNASLTAIEARSRRILPVDLATSEQVPDTESHWIGPYFDTDAGDDGPEARYARRESLELAFVAALQHLPARQRAALILREVLGFSARDAAQVLETSVASVNSALQHARTTVEARVPAVSQQATLRALGDAQLAQIVGRYVQALEHGDVDGMVALLTEDATWCMPPYSQWYSGREAIREFLRTGPMTVRWLHRRTELNGQVAIGCYLWEESAQRFHGEVVDVLDLDGDRIAAVTAFIDHDLFAHCGLPPDLPAE